MRFRDTKKFEYVLFPSDAGYERGAKRKIFKSKVAAFKYVSARFKDYINGVLRRDYDMLGSSGTQREWFIWYNEYGYHEKGENFKVELRQLWFRGKRKMARCHYDDGRKKYFAYSNKIIKLMCSISKAKGEATPKQAKDLYDLFVKRGIRVNDPIDEETRDYIDYYLNKSEHGVDYYYWSDRCHYQRAMTVIADLRRKGLLNV